MPRAALWAAAAALALASAAPAADRVALPDNPALSPDGSVLAFDWRGDVWTCPAAGGPARPLTRNPARDRSPKFSPDGTEIAFVSDRDGSFQVYVMPAAGGPARQVTFHTAGFQLHGWAADGRLLVSSQQDHAWRHAERFFLVDARERTAPTLLFDDYGSQGSLSPDGKKLLFTREGSPWWRKGYRGSQAGQVWVYDLADKTFAPQVREEWDARWPLWKADGRGFYYVSGRGGVHNLYERDLGKPGDRKLSTSTDDSVVYPAVSRDGGTLVYRQLFDLYTLRTGNGATPKKLDIVADADLTETRTDRRTLTSATSAAFTPDGLEIAVISGGDLWVMDTELKEPRAVTHTPFDERNPVFTADRKAILFIAELPGGKQEVMTATKTDPAKPWWLQEKFEVKPLTTDGETKAALTVSPDGSKIAYVRGRGDLWVSDPDGKNARAVLKSWNDPTYTWSPDGKWLAYAVSDTDFNRDVFIAPVDGSRPAFNVSRHPYNDDAPVWSPDGKTLAFVGAREQKENVDIHLVPLRAEDAEKTPRDRALERAIEKTRPAGPPVPMKKDAGDDPQAKQPKQPAAVTIDFDNLRDRVRRVTIPNVRETGLFWSPDGKRLAFSGTVGGQAGVYTIDATASGPNVTPTQISGSTGSDPRWLANGTIVWLAQGTPAAFTPGSGAAATPAPAAPTGPRPGGPGAGGTGRFGGAAPATGGYSFSVPQEVDLPKRHRAAFELAWLTMRDNWYDERLGNRDWEAVRRKYVDAAETPDPEALATVINLMLGELNGSHLGFTPTAAGVLFGRRGPGGGADEPAGRGWTPTTAHLGVRFADRFDGPGLKVRDVLPGGPADRVASKLRPNEVVTKIDGRPVTPKTDLTTVLNGPAARDVAVEVKGENDATRTVVIRPIAPAAARTLLYDAWLRDNRAAVDKLSGGTLGYLHISAMSAPSFYKFEEALYDAGAGKDGLVIDVRENGGGSTADWLLTALTQPKHAIAVPRGGGPGYPQDRTVFATWTKPIVVLCNQNSFSNAEIFSHAVKTLKRGKLVGVPTAGGVVSTGATTVMDVGVLRLPFRGWYLVNDGEDMELHGAVPDVVVWPEPGDHAAGKDRQLEAAVKVLAADVDAEKKKPQPALKKATERGK